MRKHVVEEYLIQDEGEQGAAKQTTLRVSELEIEQRSASCLSSLRPDSTDSLLCL